MNAHQRNQNVNLYFLSAVLLALGPSAQAAEAADSSITLKSAFKDFFLVGAALNQRQFTEQDTEGAALVKLHFNSVSPENVMKWQLIHPRPGAEGYNFELADRYVEFGEKNGMHIVGHTLVWHNQTPNWVFAANNSQASGSSPSAVPSSDVATPRGRGRGFDGPRASREELLGRMREHIHAVVGRYKGKIKAWDVVNEAIADGSDTNILRKTLWLEIIGPDYIAKAFEYAHEADPKAVLRYNDYGLENPAKRQKLIALIKSLQKQNVPVHAIGSQAHLNLSANFESMDLALTEMGTLGLPIHITELDVNTATGGQRSGSADVGANASATQGALVEDADRRQAEVYAGIFRAFLKHANSIELVTFWGVNDAVSWRARGRPLLFDGQNRPKPAFDRVISEAKQSTK